MAAAARALGRLLVLLAVLAAAAGLRTVLGLPGRDIAGAARRTGFLLTAAAAAVALAQLAETQVLGFPGWVALARRPLLLDRPLRGQVAAAAQVTFQALEVREAAVAGALTLAELPGRQAPQIQEVAVAVVMREASLTRRAQAALAW